MVKEGDKPGGGAQPPESGAGAPTPDRSWSLRPRFDFDSWIVTGVAIVLALLLGGVLIAFGDEAVREDAKYFFASPGRFFSDAWTAVSEAYSALFAGAVYDPQPGGGLKEAFKPLAYTIFAATPLICAGLGMALAFRVGLFNIGGEGQVTVGAFAAGFVGFAVDLPVLLHLVVAIAAGVAAGGLWGFIAGFLKARTGAHEVITTIMLNFVALLGVQMLLQQDGIRDPQTPQVSRVVEESARLPRLAGGGLPIDLGIILALLAAILVSWLFSRTALGFRLRMVGANQAAARTAGVGVGRTMSVAMLLSGGLAGLGGMTLALGGATSYQVTPAISSNVGFDALTVALLGRSRVWPTVAAGLLFGALRAGSRTMQAQTGVSIDLVTVIQALIVLFVASPLLVRAIVRLRNRGKATASSGINLSPALVTVRPARVPRHIVAGAIQVSLGLLSIGLLAFSDRSDGTVLLQTALPGALFDPGIIEMTAQPLILVMAGLAVVAGVLRILDAVSGRWCASLAIFGLFGAFMAWAVAGNPSGLNLVSLLQGTIFPAAIPLVFGAMAGIIGERSGVLNIAIEGQLLLGAFCAALAASVVANPWVGVAGGALAGLALGAILATLSIRYFVDQAIIGVVLNVLALGLTSFLYKQLLVPNPTEFNSPSNFERWKVPLLSDLPLVGPVLAEGTLFLYAAFALIAATHFGLFHTRAGLRLRAVGEHPRAADTLGINVQRTRFRATLLGGLIAGVGGSFLIVGAGSAVTFSENMTSGMGYIALATVIFGRWTPKGAVLAALLFGFVTQLQSLLSLAGAPINPNILLMAPYVATLVAVVAFVGHSRAPAADGQPYKVG
ncbi:ABC transporter permease subunit [Dactylosporangium roseum]|nr:hypothetical protein [Dactylosporangium roseum]